MAAGLLLGMLAASLVGTAISSAVQLKANSENVQAQKDINAANLQNQSEVNQANIDYSKEFAQNNIQWKMDDLRAAGLNPVLAAQGAFGGTSSPTALQSTQQKAPVVDYNGIGSAITALNNTMLTGYLISQRNNIQSDRNDILSDKNDVLRGLYQRKGQYLQQGKAALNSAGTVQKLTKAQEKEWNAILKELKSMPYKY